MKALCYSIPPRQINLVFPDSLINLIRAGGSEEARIGNKIAIIRQISAKMTTSLLRRKVISWVVSYDFLFIYNIIYLFIYNYHVCTFFFIIKQLIYLLIY